MSGAVLILPNGARLQGDPADPAFRAMVAELVGSPAPTPPAVAWPFPDPHQDGDVLEDGRIVRVEWHDGMRVERYLDPKHAPKRAGDQPPRRAAV